MPSNQCLGTYNPLGNTVMLGLIVYCKLIIIKGILHTIKYALLIDKLLIKLVIIKSKIFIVYTLYHAICQECIIAVSHNRQILVDWCTYTLLNYLMWYRCWKQSFIINKLCWEWILGILDFKKDSKLVTTITSCYAGGNHIIYEFT